MVALRKIQIPKREPYIQWRISCAGDVDFAAFEDPMDAIARFPSCAGASVKRGILTVSAPYGLVRERIPKSPPPPPPFLKTHYEIRGIVQRAKNDIGGICDGTIRDLGVMYDDILKDVRAKMDARFPVKKVKARRKAA